MRFLKAGVELDGFDIAGAERSIWTAIAAPIIYSLIIPIGLIDLWVSVYQQICFRVYGISRVRRSDYIVVDRQMLPYLNVVGKLNCAFCGYANGVIAFVREVAARTEQYWCPIKHARELPAVHARYHDFAEYGDERGYEAVVTTLRDRLRQDVPPTSL